MATEQTFTATRLERVLASMVASAVVLSLICFFAVILAGPLGYSLDNTFGAVVVVLPLIGLPIGFILMITLLIISSVRRRKGEEAPH